MGHQDLPSQLPRLRCLEVQGTPPPRHPGCDDLSDVGRLLGPAPSEHRPGSGPQDPARGGLSVAPDFHASPHLEEGSSISPEAMQPPGRGSVSEPGAGPGLGLSPTSRLWLCGPGCLSPQRSPTACELLRPPPLRPPPPPAGISTLGGSLVGSQGSLPAHTHAWLQTLALRTSLGGARVAGPLGAAGAPCNAHAWGGSWTMRRISLAEGVITPHTLPGSRRPWRGSKGARGWVCVHSPLLAARSAALPNPVTWPAR